MYDYVKVKYAQVKNAYTHTHAGRHTYGINTYKYSLFFSCWIAYLG